MTDLASLSPAAAEAAGAGWSGGELALRFGAPIALLLVGLTIYLYGITQRREIQDGARSAGSVDEETGIALRATTSRVLSGLLLMLLGLVLLFTVIIWRVVSGAE